MKSFLFLALSFISFSTFAQNIPIESRIELRLERLNDLVLKERAHQYLNEAQKREVLQNINQAISAIRADQTPIPPTNPYPPTIPQPQLITVEGKIESTNISFQGNTLGQVFNQCSDFVRSRISQADDMMISFNGNAYIRQTTTGWWSGPDAICNVIYTLATPQNLTVNSYQNLLVEGFVEGVKVEFVGSSYGEVFNKCVRNLETKLTQADDMEISVNGDRRYRLTTTGWWTGAHAICQSVMKNVPRI